MLKIQMISLNIGLILLAGCAGSTQPDLLPDQRYGHRYEGPAPDGRMIAEVAPPDDPKTHRMGTAQVDSLHIRQGKLTEGGAKVEVLVKGWFPDGCTSLASVAQHQEGQAVNVALRTKRPAEAMCTQAIQPFRYYLPLEGTFATGTYRFTLNDHTVDFEVK